MAKSARRAESKQALSKVATESILESISDGVFTVDQNWHITSFNRAAEQITGVARDQAIGRRCSEVFRAATCESACALKRTIESGSPLINHTTFIIRHDGRRVPISLSTALLRGHDGQVLGGAETFRDLSVVETLRRELRGRSELADIVTRSEAMHQVLEMLPRIATSQSTILVRGETGTGKELVARAIHELGPRRAGPFVAINCGAIPDALLESELFGYKAGAFTGATRDKPGRLSLAQGGTLLLDEIGELSQALQVKLLRVLEERQYEPLGALRSEQADIRIIAATHRNLAAMVERGEFRRDLYYRICVMEVELLPLRGRREDIPVLTEHFIARFNALENKNVTGVRADALARLMVYDFPGNVRELQNIIEHAFVLVEQGPIGVEHLPSGFGRAVPRSPAPQRKLALEEVESRAIEDALRSCAGNRLAAARKLGIHKSTLFRRIKQLGVVPPETDGRQSCRTVTGSATMSASVPRARAATRGAPDERA